MNQSVLGTMILCNKCAAFTVHSTEQIHVFSLLVEIVQNKQLCDITWFGYKYPKAVQCCMTCHTADSDTMVPYHFCYPTHQLQALYDCQARVLCPKTAMECLLVIENLHE